MLGKGAKRKLDEDDEGLEGEALAVGAGASADGLSKVSYTLQRQTIFNISLMKLYNQRALAEPSLEKRVLINNMLRRIQEELKQEGSLRPLLFPPSPPADDPVDEGFREAQPAFSVLSVVTTAPLSQPPAPLPTAAAPSSSPSALAGHTPLDACLTPASLLEEDSTAFCTSPSPLSPLSLEHGSPRLSGPGASDSFSSALDEIEELCPSVAATTAAGPTTTSPSTLTATLHLPLQSTSQPAGASDSKDCSKSCSPKLEGLSSLPTERPAVAMVAAESKIMETLSPSGLDMSTSPSSSSSGFLTDLALDDILFADIDTSMYDFDPCTSAAGASPSKLAPVVTADDLLKTLSPYSGAAPAVNSNQPFKMDLTELDHIMEVLVGS
ncbi:SERTA domain-containing protein 2b [Electrophorus electricus]|uniref:SERTA domain-containing protein n=1 Tax=Electrophorus electricus TaxID=8005 RepID=A0A4W4E1W3_ELEEL|nr:SERTA domain-containing protein 2b [Electrophorus electricus]XP_026873418.1 SERTA domain-containing protein 2b [Electrophorus electricus]XP_026873419.1 SERTA domain-containing protein 2b [Electrophorus electricus]XP_026873420.1 SERTA domain-containing protein 2b [Electrophorus electricus]XP_026873421.1 SERTA domain-containing protein 2b [Electrophorus electricus]XP_026873422.1 SERTA domain-containing protein 2b [Electrophorus electricus]XP_026873423.1 SERTA domain-containing protein 2b [El